MSEFSKGTITLSNPLKIMDHTYKKLKYNSEKITGEMWDEAVSHQTKEYLEVDSAVHRYFGYEAVIAEQPDIDIRDLERNIHGEDLYKFTVVGRNFTEEWLLAYSQESTGGDSENTPTTAAQESESSKSNQ